MKLSRRICLALLLCLPTLGCAQQKAAHADDAGPHAYAGKPVSVAELEQIVAPEEKKRDSAKARELFGLRLTERLSSARRAALTAALPGTKAKEALTALADASDFLSLPPAEIPAKPAPDLNEQRRMVALTVDYLSRTIPRLPNFYATRTTIHYEDTEEDEDRPGVSVYTGESLHWAGVSTATVIYRHGNEEVDAGPVKGKRSNPVEAGLVTRGTFGPILSTVILDAAHGQISFDHWELWTNGLVAVFGFAVEKAHSHYDVALRNPSHGNAPEHPTQYHGEMSLDPETGAIVRLMLKADPELGDAMVRADTLVEYGPVDIGGKTYICPVKSVSFSQGHSEMLVRTVVGLATRAGPVITRLNDLTFGDYHVFRTEMRVLTGDDPPPDEKP